jgi:hypothetical protein
MTTHWCTLIAICGLHKLRKYCGSNQSYRIENWGKLDGMVHKGWKKGGEGGIGCGSNNLEERGPEAVKRGLIAGDCDVVGARL